jgi:trehalose 6-phosphate synthase
MSEGDRRARKRSRGGAIHLDGHQQLSLRFVQPSQRAYNKYYNVFCNPLLWFLQHYMWNTPYAPAIDRRTHDAWETGYVAVNELFADAVAAEAGGPEAGPVVMLQDYHLYMAAGSIRRRLPNAFIQHFIHIPWPTPVYWQLLPPSMREAMYRSLCSSDIIGMQTRRDVLNFLQCADTVLPDADVDYRRQRVQVRDHVTSVRAYPISVDTAELRETAGTDIVRNYRDKLAPLRGERTIVRVDRAELSKNILRGFDAFEHLLQAHPEFLGKVKFWAFLVPSRTGVPEYRQYVRHIDRWIERINARYGTDAWTPIEVFYEDNRAQALAAMQDYDVLLVNAIIDGMNLVAKEGPIVNERDGVLILSETTGAFDQLAWGALPVAPADVEGTARALYEALTMPARERRARTRLLQDTIMRQDIVYWMVQQMEDMHRLTQAKAG